MFAIGRLFSTIQEDNLVVVNRQPDEHTLLERLRTTTKTKEK